MRRAQARFRLRSDGMSAMCARRGQPGKYARILLRRNRERIAVTGMVAEAVPGDVDAFLSSALVWFTRTRERLHAPFVQKLWLVVEHQCVEATAHRLALLRADLRSVVTLYELDEDWLPLGHAPWPEREALLSAHCSGRLIMCRGVSAIVIGA